MKRKETAGNWRRIFTLPLALLAVVCLAMPARAEWSGDPKGDDTDFSLYDYDYDPGRVYAKSSALGEVYTFHTLGSDGLTYNCLPMGDDEAVLYELVAANGGPITIQETIYDSVSEKTRKIVGLIAGAERQESDSDWEYEEDPFTFIHNYGQRGITDLTLPKTIRFIGRGAFYGYQDLKSVTFQSDAGHPLTIERQAFRACPVLEKVTFSTGGKVTVQPRAFMECTSLKTISFPAGSEVSDYALQGCTGLESVYNAPSCVYIGEFEGNNAPPLSTVHYAEGLTEISGVSGYYIKEDEDGEGGTQEDLSFSRLKDVRIPSSARIVSGFGNTGLETVELPEGLEELEWRAFEDCSQLKSINLPSTLKKIGESAFEDCTALTGISSLPAGVQNVENLAFRGCRNLHMNVRHPQDTLEYQYKDSGITSLTLPNDIFLLYPGGLTGCADLQNITIEGGTNKGGGMMTRDGILYLGAYHYDRETDKSTFEGWLLGKYPAGRSKGSYTLPSDIMGLDGFAFEGCKFTEIHLPETMTLSLPNYMAGIDGEGTHPHYALDDMASHPTLYLIEGSEADAYFSYYEPHVYEGKVKEENPSTGGNSQGSTAGSGSSAGTGTSTGTGTGTGNFTEEELKAIERIQQQLDAYQEKEEKAQKLTVKSLKVKAAKKKKAKISWKKAASASGYQIQYSTDKKFKKGVKTKKVSGAAKTSVTIKKLKAKKKYYFRIRSYTVLKHVSGTKDTVYGKWSKAKKVKIKK